MDNTVKATINECATASAEGIISFGEVVGKLIGVGVERYLVDYVRGDTTYYLPNGDTETVPLHITKLEPGEIFTASGVEAAVRGAQSGALDYNAFTARVMEAGCVGYLASMAGKRVVYYGRAGDTHIEWFPGAK